MPSMSKRNRVIAGILSIIGRLLTSCAPQERACARFGMRQADSAFQSVGADTKPVETGSPSTSPLHDNVSRSAYRDFISSIGSTNRYSTGGTRLSQTLPPKNTYLGNLELSFPQLKRVTTPRAIKQEHFCESSR